MSCSDGIRVDSSHISKRVLPGLVRLHRSGCPGQNGARDDLQGHMGSMPVQSIGWDVPPYTNSSSIGIIIGGGGGVLGIPIKELLV